MTFVLYNKGRGRYNWRPGNFSISKYSKEEWEVPGERRKESRTDEEKSMTKVWPLEITTDIWTARTEGKPVDGENERWGWGGRWTQAGTEHVEDLECCLKQMEQQWFIFLIFLFYTGVKSINNAVIPSGRQQRDSVIHIHVSILRQTPLSSSCHITLNRVPCAIQ